MDPARSLIERAARARIARVSAQIMHSLRAAADHNPLAAERDPGRLLARLQAKAMLSREEASAIAAGIHARGAGEGKGAARRAAGPERIWGGTIDFVGVAFLERGARAARAVARVAHLDGSPLGTGFLVSERLFLTNNHVLASAAEAGELVLEFGYELDPADRQREATRFALDASAFFLTDDQNDLDYTLVALGARRSGSHELAEFGWCGLSGATDKHALGEVANIVQHPQGRYKEVVLRENRLVSRLDTVLHYVADTEPGSSGSPVFNNEWRVIALHHWGGPWRQKADDSGVPVPGEVNEGIRTSAILRELQARAAALGTSQRALLERVFALGEPESMTFAAAEERPEPVDGTPRIDPDGRVTWRVPLELSVRLPVPASNGVAPASASSQPPVAPSRLNGTGAQAERKPDPDYDARQGYKPKFIQGFTVPLPALSSAQKKIAAPNEAAGPGDDPFELKYNHFSVVLNRVRKLAFFTACNIDGRTAKDIDRKTGAISHYEPGANGEALDGGAEASERWYEDERLAEGDGTSQDLYASQEVPGYAKGTKAWMNRMLQRGHLVRRLDPAWGTNEQAFAAEADTFHFTNCTPQVGFFNTGSAPKSMPKSGGGLLWRAIEDYVRDNAAVEDLRVCVFTGPVLKQDDPLWREQVIPGFRVPLKFWKLVAWAEGGKLRAVAMVADQEPVLKKLPEALDDAEDYTDTSAVKDFVTSVAHLEQLIGLDFGAQLRAADLGQQETLAGGRARRMREVKSFAEVFAKRGRRGGGEPLKEIRPQRNARKARRRAHASKR